MILEAFLIGMFAKLLGGSKKDQGGGKPMNYHKLGMMQRKAATEHDKKHGRRYPYTRCSDPECQERVRQINIHWQTKMRK